MDEVRYWIWTSVAMIPLPTSAYRYAMTQSNASAERITQEEFDALNTDSIRLRTVCRELTRQKLAIVALATAEVNDLPEDMQEEYGVSQAFEDHLREFAFLQHRYAAATAESTETDAMLMRTHTDLTKLGGLLRKLRNQRARIDLDRIHQAALRGVRGMASVDDIGDGEAEYNQLTADQRAGAKPAVSADIRAEFLALIRDPANQSGLTQMMSQAKTPIGAARPVLPQPRGGGYPMPEMRMGVPMPVTVATDASPAPTPLASAHHVPPPRVAPPSANGGW